MTDEELKKLVKERLLKMGINIPTCSKCGEELLFAKTRIGKYMPMTLAFISHFSNCPAAKEFRKKD